MLGIGFAMLIIDLPVSNPPLFFFVVFIFIFSVRLCFGTAVFGLVLRRNDGVLRSGFFLFACFLFACVLICLLVTMAQDNTKLCDFTNTNNNDFISIPIAPLTDAESIQLC